MNTVVTKNNVLRFFFFMFGLFFLALNYNLLLYPNHLVIGGVSGVSIIFNEVIDLDPVIFIYITNILLVFLSILLLGMKKSVKSIVGSILFPLMITITMPLSNLILPYFNFEYFWIVLILTGILHGVSNGIIFKTGYSTGGTDILILIFSKYLKIPQGKSMMFINTIIIASSGLVFGLEKMLYSIMVIYLSSNILDRVMFNISINKVFYVFTSKKEEVEKLILNDFHTGCSEIPMTGAFSHHKGSMLLAVVSNREYFDFKRKILKIDPNAFFIISDCYESHGGYKNNNIPHLI